MSTETVAPGDGADVMPAPVVAPAQEQSAIDVTEAARQMRAWRDQQQKAAAAPKEAAPAQELAETPNSDPPQEAPAETTDEVDPADGLPPIEPPRSWTSEAKDRWQTLPRETQEYLAQREQERDREVRRRQNEEADSRKAIEAERIKFEQARQQYEQASNQTLQVLHDLQASEFSDIKSLADAQKLSQEDPVRYLKWRAAYDLIDAKQREVAQAQARQQAEFAQKWSEFADKEDQLLVEKAPELADKARSTKVADAAVNVLKDIGFNEDDLGKLWNGQASLSLRDHRTQLLILDAVRYREAKANIAKPAAKPVPTVQRPGVSKGKGELARAAIDQARERLSTARGNASINAALELYRAQRQAQG